MGDFISIDNQLIWLQRHAKTKKGLFVILVSFILLFGISEQRLPNNLAGNVFVIGLIFICFSWWYYRNKSKLAIGKEIKIAFAFQTDDNENVEKINKILNPVINKLKKNPNLEFISFVDLPANQLISEHCARKYVEHNHYGIERLLWLKIEIGLIDDRESLIIKDTNFFYKNIPERVIFKGVEINLQNEIKFITATSNIKVIKIDQLLHKENLKEELRQIVLYFLGISCVLEMKFAESLQILKEIYIPQNSVIIGRKEKENNRIVYELKRENLLSARLRDLLAEIYSQVVWQYHKMDNIKKAYWICIEAKEMLGEIAPAYWLYVQLSRLSYEMGRTDDAKIYTLSMRKIAHCETDEVILNEGFFAILDNKISEVVSWYKKLSPNTLTCNVMDVIVFLNNYNPEFVSQERMRDYAVGILTMYFVEERDGRSALTRLKKKIKKDDKYSNMISHINAVLDLKIAKKTS